MTENSVRNPSQVMLPHPLHFFVGTLAPLRAVCDEGNERCRPRSLLWVFLIGAYLSVA